MKNNFVCFISINLTDFHRKIPWEDLIIIFKTVRPFQRYKFLKAHRNRHRLLKANNARRIITLLKNILLCYLYCESSILKSQFHKNVPNVGCLLWSRILIREKSQPSIHSFLTLKIQFLSRLTLPKIKFLWSFKAKKLHKSWVNVSKTIWRN